MPTQFLAQPIDYLKGVGEQRATILKKDAGIFTYGDLLYYFPYKYIDKSVIHTIASLTPDMPYVQLRGKITSVQVLGVARAQRMVATFADASGTIELTWFQSINYLKQSISVGNEYVAFGKITDYKGKYSIVHPEMELYTPALVTQQIPLYPAYNTTEKMKNRGLDSKAISKLMLALVTLIKQKQIIFPETLSPAILEQYRLMSATEAIIQLHFPSNNATIINAQNRIKFEELFFLQLKLIKLKKLNQQNIRGHVFSIVGAYFNEFYKQIPFTLTGAQKRVLKEIRNDVGTGKHMNRLIQGDVGSGKTIVALMSMLLAIDNTYQACLMAPTEILATQHFHGITELLKDLPVTVKLLTGSTKIKERRSIHAQLLSGELNILIGTHALIEEVVQFKNLGIAIIDEQHRFGVEQRFKLWKKNSIAPPHVLVMTATPIPRTLAMTLYGDLDISTIDELPAGRKPIKTIHYTENKRLMAYGLMREQIALGRQVYVVYPLIDESETLDFQNLMQGFDNIVSYFPEPQYRVSVVHGQMSAADKEASMQQFVKGNTHIMIATTVIEVGVNVPNASVMIIESAERFGLSQLHQLRGRVGRGADQSYCTLITGFKLSADSKLRMSTMCETNDGFKISEVDLKLRGAGDIHGTQQSGIMNFKLADLAKDQQILIAARNTAIDIMNDDPNLNLPQHAGMKVELHKIETGKTNWSRIS
ncbi:MAG: ATP-dependent DNA helicase RecG [Bacteroidia bacterium]